MRSQRSSDRIAVLAASAAVLALVVGGGCGYHRAFCTTGCGSCSGSALMAGPGGCADGACTGDVYPGTCGARSLGSCGGLSGFCLPLLSTRLACGSGCGDIYWNEWICDPPECCDPCSDGGCWVGPAPCAHPGGVIWGAVQRVKGAVVRVVHLGLYGYRPGYCGGCETGCAGCGVDNCLECSECMDCGVAGCNGGCAQAVVGDPTLATRGNPSPSRAAAYAGRSTRPSVARGSHRIVARQQYR
jgi:hypothetical protein